MWAMEEHVATGEAKARGLRLWFLAKSVEW